MSYNNLTVNDVKSSDLALNNVITISSPNDGQILQKKSSNWGTITPSNAAESKIGYLASSASGNTTYKYDVADNYMFRKTSGEFFLTENITFTNASGSYVPVPTSAWTMGFNLDGTFFNNKTVLLYAVVNPYRFSASQTVFQWGVGTGSLGSWSSLGPKAIQTDVYGAPCWGIYTGSGTTETLTLKVISKSGNTAISNGAVARVGSVIMKVIKE